MLQDTIDMRRAEWRKKIHKERAKALNDLHDQVKCCCLQGSVKVQPFIA